LPSPSTFPGIAPVDFLFQQYLAIDDGHLNAHRFLNEPFLISRQICTTTAFRETQRMKTVLTYRAST
jgi:hypothetical protein